VLPKPFSTATQFLEQSIATHIALVDRKIVILKRKKKLFIIEYNFTKKLDLFLMMRRVSLVRLFPVTVDDGIDVHVNASYFQAQGVRQLSCCRLPIFAVVVVESRIHIIYWGRGEIRRILCALFFYPFLILFCFYSFPFLMSSNFYIINKNHISKTFPSRIGSRPTVWEALIYAV
jgi:hypothetical protein